MRVFIVSVFASVVMLAELQGQPNSESKDGAAPSIRVAEFEKALASVKIGDKFEDLCGKFKAFNFVDSLSLAAPVIACGIDREIFVFNFDSNDFKLTSVMRWPVLRRDDAVYVLPKDKAGKKVK